MSGRWFRPNFHVESFLRSIVQKSHINHRSELSGDHIQQWAMISSKPSCREFLEIYSTKEPHQSQKWAIWRPFPEWAMISSKFSCREFLEIYSTKITHINHKVTYRETIFRSGRWFRPNFHVESFLRSIVQKSHINHRSELSGDHIQQWAMISSKPSCREFLEIYSTKEPHQSQSDLWWDHFHWVGDDFVQILMSRVSWDI